MIEPEYDLVKVGAQIARKIKADFSLVVGTDQPLHGKNTGYGKEYYAGIWYSFH